MKVYPDEYLPLGWLARRHPSDLLARSHTLAPKPYLQYSWLDDEDSSTTEKNIPSPQEYQAAMSQHPQGTTHRILKFTRCRSQHQIRRPLRVACQFHVACARQMREGEQEAQRRRAERRRAIVIVRNRAHFCFLWEKPLAVQTQVWHQLDHCLKSSWCHSCSGHTDKHTHTPTVTRTHIRTAHNIPNHTVTLPFQNITSSVMIPATTNGSDEFRMQHEHRGREENRRHYSGLSERTKETNAQESPEPRRSEQCIRNCACRHHAHT